MLFRIDKRSVKRTVDHLGPAKKTEKGLNVPLVAESYKKSVWNLMDNLQDKDAYTMYNWMVHVERWIENQSKNSTTPYERGELIYIELGAMNFGYENSYEHPAIVLANSYNMILVIPGSSQTYGKGHRDVIDISVTEATGLTRDTGFNLNNMKWISKNRVLDRRGSVTNIVKLDHIEKYQIKQLAFSRVIEASYENEIFNLTRKINDQQKEVDAFKDVIQSVEELLIKHGSQDLLDSFRMIAAAK